jgi:hypothetical protein
MNYVVACHYHCGKWAVAYRPGSHKLTCGSDDSFEHGIACKVCLAERPHYGKVYVCSEHARATDVPFPEHVPPNWVPPLCEHCGKSGNIRWVGSRTAYVTDDEMDSISPPSAWERLRRYFVHGDDPVPSPNANSALCADCEVDHDAYWDEMWAEYNASRGC